MVLVAVRRGGRLRGVLPLVEERVRLGGVPVLRLRGAANVHSCRFDLVHGRGDAGATGAAAWRALRAERWDALELRDVPLGGAALGFVEAARADGYPAGFRESMRTPYVPLAAGTRPAVDAKFRGNLRRRRRKLEAKGHVAWRRSGEAEAPLLSAFLALERAGWKGRTGTAIALDERTRAFYGRLAAEAAGRGALALHALELDGTPVAVHFGLEHRGRYFLPKPAYDETHRECSPGQLLVEEVLRDAAARGLHEFDFLGPWMDWKGEWTRHVRPHGFVHVYGKGPAGRLLHAVKFGIAPAARRLRRMGGAMEAVARRYGGGEAEGDGGGSLVASALPTLGPGMVWPRTRRAAVPFPFDDPGVRYFYYARNAVYALARLWNLAGQEVLFPAYFHGVELEAPYEWFAIGDPSTLSIALQIPGGAMATVRGTGATGTVEEQDEVEVTALRRLPEPSYATPAPPEGG